MSFSVFIRPMSRRSQYPAKFKRTRSSPHVSLISEPPRAPSNRRLLPSVQVLSIECRLIGRNDVSATYTKPTESDFEVAGWPDWNDGHLGEAPKVRAVQEELAFVRLYCPSKGPHKMRVSVELNACEDSFPSILSGRTMLGHATERLFEAYRALCAEGQSGEIRRKAIKRWLRLVRHYRYDPFMFRRVAEGEGSLERTEIQDAISPDLSVIPMEVSSDLRSRLDSQPLPLDPDLFRSIDFEMVSRRVANGRFHVRYATEIEIPGPEDGSLVIGWESEGRFHPIPLFRDQGLGGMPVHALKVSLTDAAALDTQILSGVDVYKDAADLVGKSCHTKMCAKESIAGHGAGRSASGENPAPGGRSHCVLPRRLPTGAAGGLLRTCRLASTRVCQWMNGLRDLYPEHGMIHLLPLEEYSRCGGSPRANSMRFEAGRSGAERRMVFDLEYPYSGFRYQYDQVSNRLDPSLGTQDSYGKFIRRLSRLGWRVMLDVHVSKVAAAGYKIYATPAQTKLYDEILFEAGLRRKPKSEGAKAGNVYLDLYQDRLDCLRGGALSIKSLPAYSLFFLKRVPGGEPWDPAARPEKLSEIGRAPLVRLPEQSDWGFGELNIADTRVAAIRLLMFVEQFRSLYGNVSTGAALRLDCHHIAPDQYQRHAFTGLLMNLLRRLFRDRGGLISMAEIVAEDPTRHGHQTSTDIVQPLNFLQVIGKPEGLEMLRGVEGRYEHYLVKQILTAQHTPSFTVGTSNHDTPAAIEPQGADNAILQRAMTLGDSGAMGNLWNAVSYDTYLALRPGAVMLDVVGDSYGAIRHHNPKGEPANGFPAGLIRFDHENLAREAIWSHSLPQRRGFLKRWLGRYLRSGNVRRIHLDFKCDGALVGDFSLCQQTGVGRLLLRNLRNERYPIEFDWVDVIRDPEELGLIQIHLESGEATGCKLFELFNHSTVVKQSTVSPWLEEVTGRRPGGCLSEGFGLPEIKPWEVMVFVFLPPRKESIQELEMNMVRTVPLGRLAALWGEGLPKNQRGLRLGSLSEGCLQRRIDGGPRGEGAAFAELKRRVKSCFARENTDREVHREMSTSGSVAFAKAL